MNTNNKKNIVIKIGTTSIIKNNKVDITLLKSLAELIIDNKNKFNFVLVKYPNTDFAMDAKFKIELIQDILASKEMYLGRHYIKRNKWIAAINRFKYVVDNYEETIFIEEALHRLVEVHYFLGLEKEAKKYATILGYNYNSSEWFKQSYKILNKEYKIVNKSKLNDKKKNDKSFIKKIIKMIK